MRQTDHLESALVKPELPKDQVREKRSVVLSGFFGRGNCGDEAILQTQFERLSPYFDIVISVDEYGAYERFWDWYPYNLCPIVHQGNLSAVADEKVVALHVGGGGLPHGFNAAQVVHARSHGKLAFLTGVDAKGVVSPAAVGDMRAYLSLFDYVSVRSSGSQKTMRSFNSNCHLGTDWAFGLLSDGDQSILRKSRVLLTLREFNHELLSTEYNQRIEKLVSWLSDRHDQVAMLPFCPEDERFLDVVPAVKHLPREVYWWDPRKVQSLIGAASLVISVGRLHPMVFSANVQTAAVFVEPLPGISVWTKSVKAYQLCRQHGWHYFGTVEEMQSYFGQNRSPTRLSYTADTASRWVTMGQEIEERCSQYQVAARGN